MSNDCKMEKACCFETDQKMKTKVLHFWDDDDEASSSPVEFDISELQNLFPAHENVKLIEFKRAYNCEIMLSKLKIPLNDLMEYVLALDDTQIGPDMVENLIKVCPTMEEMEKLKEYKGETENLRRCEQFFMELMKVPRPEAKLKAFYYKIQFSSQVSELSKNLNIVFLSVEQITSSVKLRRVMQTILSLGNALNQGTERGAAAGFKLDSLLKLNETRAKNKKMTLMHYLCKVLADKLPELLDFSKELSRLEPASKLQLRNLAEEMLAIVKGLDRVIHERKACKKDGHVSKQFRKVLADKLPELLDFSKELSRLEPASKLQLRNLAEEMLAIVKGLDRVIHERKACKKDGHVSKQFRKNLKTFLASAEGEAKSLNSLYTGVGKSMVALIIYFGEDANRCTYEQVISTLKEFVRLFNQSHDDNCKQIEAEKKAAQMEAEQEKLEVFAATDSAGALSD